MAKKDSSSKKQIKKFVKKQRQYKPIVLLYKAEDENSSFLSDWTFFGRYKNRQIALGEVINQLTKTGLFMFKIKGEEQVFIRGED